jgi:hypothetical protein
VGGVTDTLAPCKNRVEAGDSGQWRGDETDSVLETVEKDTRFAECNILYLGEYCA